MVDLNSGPNPYENQLIATIPRGSTGFIFTSNLVRVKDKN